MQPLLTRWAKGPDDDDRGPVVVSVTDFTAHRTRDMPHIVATGLRLRLGWYAMPGAVALALWSLPLERRSGSISIWASEQDLRRFVGLPRHLAVMRRFRDRGTLRATSWQSERFVSHEAVRAARRWIAERPA